MCVWGGGDVCHAHKARCVCVCLVSPKRVLFPPSHLLTHTHTHITTTYTHTHTHITTTQSQQQFFLQEARRGGGGQGGGDAGQLRPAAGGHSPDFVLFLIFKCISTLFSTSKHANKHTHTNKHTHFVLYVNVCRCGWRSARRRRRRCGRRGPRMWRGRGRTRYKHVKHARTDAR